MEDDRTRHLLESPYEDSRRRRLWPWLVGGVGAVAAVAALVFLLSGLDGRPNDSVEPFASSSSTLTVGNTAVPPDTTAAESVVNVLSASRPEYGPEPEFDTSGLGDQQHGLVSGETLPVDLAWLDETEVTALAISERLVLGTESEGSSLLQVVRGIIVDPYLAAFGAPGSCYRMSSGADGLTDCITYDRPGSPTALFTELVGGDMVVWGLLPSNASVAVLRVDGIDIAWQRPLGSSAAFRYQPRIGDVIELRVLDNAGTEIARGDRSHPSKLLGTYVEPIYGYGDFSDVAYDDIDFDEVNGLIVRCMNDEGFNVDAAAPQEADGSTTIDLSNVDQGNRAVADGTLAQCRAGLKLPHDESPLAQETLDEYDFFIVMWNCLTGSGFSIEPPPPFDRWLEHPPETRWDPNALMQELTEPPETRQAIYACLDQIGHP